MKLESSCYIYIWSLFKAGRLFCLVTIFNIFGQQLNPVTVVSRAHNKNVVSKRLLESISTLWFSFSTLHGNYTDWHVCIKRCTHNITYHSAGGLGFLQGFTGRLPQMARWIDLRFIFRDCPHLLLWVNRSLKWHCLAHNTSSCPGKRCQSQQVWPYYQLQLCGDRVCQLASMQERLYEVLYSDKCWTRQLHKHIVGCVVFLITNFHNIVCLIRGTTQTRSKSQLSLAPFSDISSHCGAQEGEGLCLSM